MAIQLRAGDRFALGAPGGELSTSPNLRGLVLYVGDEHAVVRWDGGEPIEGRYVLSVLEQEGATVIDRIPDLTDRRAVEQWLSST